MFPIVLDPARLSVALIGNGPATARRKQLLDAAGFLPMEIATEPEANQLEDMDIVFIADFDPDTTARIYAMAKDAGALVNAEDNREFCDFHVPAIVRRGDLLVTVSTNAKSPRLARRLRQELEQQFGDEWAERLEYIGKERERWKSEGASFEELAERTDAIIAKEGWLEHNQRKSA